MKLIWCTMWILGALLVAMLDTIPDPPAVNPSTRLCETQQAGDNACAAIPETSLHSLVASNPFPSGFVDAETREPHSSSDPMVLAGQAANSSPPALQA